MSLDFWFSRSSTTPIPTGPTGREINDWSIIPGFTVGAPEVYYYLLEGDTTLGLITRIRKTTMEESGEVVWIFWVNESLLMCWSSQRNKGRLHSISAEELLVHLEGAPL